MSKADRYTGKDVEVLGREQLFRGFFSMIKLTLRHKLFSGDWSEHHCAGIIRAGQLRGCAAL